MEDAVAELTGAGGVGSVDGGCCEGVAEVAAETKELNI